MQEQTVTIRPLRLRLVPKLQHGAIPILQHHRLSFRYLPALSAGLVKRDIGKDPIQILARDLIRCAIQSGYKAFMLIGIGSTV